MISWMVLHSINELIDQVRNLICKEYPSQWHNKEQYKDDEKPVGMKWKMGTVVRKV